MSSRLIILLWFVLIAPCFAAIQEQGNTVKYVTDLAATENQEPTVALPETNFDFGEVEDGNEYIHAFVIWNTGAGVLEIQKVLPG